MDNLQKYLDRLKELHNLKTGVILSDQEALEMINNLILLVSTTEYYPNQK